jgi:hypothetical protein
MPREELSELGASQAVPSCCGAHSVNDSASGEYFDVMLHTKMASKYDVDTPPQTAPLQREVVFDLGDDNNRRTNV